MISQEQANRANELCERALEQIAAIERDIAEMKKAADEFNTRMDKTDCIYPDCLIPTEFGRACEHSCEFEKDKGA